jgi:hypothetical protein
MPSPESHFSLFSRKKETKPKPKHGEVEAAKPEKETHEPTDKELIEDGLHRCEILLQASEKNKYEPKGWTHLQTVEAMMDIVDAARLGDENAIGKLRAAYLSPEERASATADVITARTPEGKEITVDIQEILTDSISFYETNGLTEFAEHLKKSAETNLSAEAKKSLQEMIETHGFDKFIILPPENIQQTPAMIQKLKTNLADKELAGLAEADQYTKSYMENGCENPTFPDTDYGKQAKAKRNNNYLFGYKSDPIPEDTKNLTYPEAEAKIQADNLNGFTLPEYYITQRKEVEQNKDHSFDAYDNDAKKSNWMRLVDSRAPGGCLRGSWDPDNRQVNVRWFGADGRNPRLGARSAVVVVLEEKL